MAERFYDLEREAHLLTGAERARLVIKDDHEKTYENKDGFLNSSERQALLRMPEHRVKEEYEALWEVYEQMPLTMAAITECYLRFKHYYESLKRAHLLLSVSPIMGYLSRLVEESISNEDVKEDALKAIDAIQVLEKGPSGKPAFKEVLSFIKEIVPQASVQARDFILMKNTVDKIGEVIGCNIFKYEHYSESCQIYAEEISLCIKEHNLIMNRSGEGMSDLSAYLIPGPNCDEQ